MNSPTLHIMMQFEPDSLTQDDLARRVNTFLSGALTIDRGSNCGLLALAVPSRFGGLYVGKRRQDWVCDTITKLGNRRVGRFIRAHLRFCRTVLQYGSFAQYDEYLPQCAAGKRHGTDTQYSYITVKNSDGGVLISGNITTSSILLDYAVIRFAEKAIGSESVIQDTLPRVVLTREMLASWPVFSSSQRKSRAHFKELFAPQSALLSTSVPLSSSSYEKWEAIRWNSDRSAS